MDLGNFSVSLLLKQKNQKNFMEYRISAWAAGMGALWVGAGAFGAHALKNTLTPEYLQTYETALRYAWYHTAALFLCDYFSRQGLPLKGPVRLFFLGIILFSGSLFVLVLTGFRMAGIITPLGGVAWIGGWIWLAISLWRFRKSSEGGPDHSE